ncbi:hypothetical protein HDU76_006490, partial [Blyttiomyces sp. JEL0837]
MFEADPRLQRLSESNPEVRRMIRDPDFLRQMVTSMRNPSYMQEMMRNHDRSLSNIESIPGGMAALSSLYSSLQQEESVLDNRPTTTEESNRRFAERFGANITTPTTGPNQNALPNPWAPAPPTTAGARSAGSGAMPNINSGFPFPNHGQPSFPSFPMFPGGGFPGSQPGTAASSSDPGSAQTGQDFFALMEQMQQLQATMESLRLMQQQPGIAASPATNASVLESGRTSTTTGAAASEPAEDPEIKFQQQLKDMEEMGFTDKAKNIKALLAAGAGDDLVDRQLEDVSNSNSKNPSGAESVVENVIAIASKDLDPEPENARSSKSENDGSSPARSSPKIDQKRQIVLHVLCVAFHHRNGPQVEYCTPQFPDMIPAGDRVEADGSRPAVDLPDEWSFLPFLCLPDGAH